MLEGEKWSVKKTIIPVLIFQSCQNTGSIYDTSHHLASPRLAVKLYGPSPVMRSHQPADELCRDVRPWRQTRLEDSTAGEGCPAAWPALQKKPHWKACRHRAQRGLHFIMQLNLYWFLKQSGQENARDWLNVKGSHIFIAFSHAWSWHKCLILQPSYRLNTLMVYAESSSWMGPCGIADFCAIDISSETWEMLIASFAVFPWWPY